MCQKNTNDQCHIIKDDSDEVIKLESKVVYALLRLQKGNRYSNKRGRQCGIDYKQIADYLSANYCHLDGDIEAQVITALLSCVKNGIVCALESGKYRLIRPSSKAIVSNCLTRTTHGPKCCCLDLIKCASKSMPNNCCLVKALSPNSFSGKIKGRKRKKQKAERRSTRNQKAKLKDKCVQKIEKMLSRSSDDITCSNEKKSKKKCKYCLEIHSSASKQSKICEACHPPGTIYGVPYDKFSPREENM